MIRNNLSGYLAVEAHSQAAPFSLNWKPTGLRPRLIDLALAFSSELLLTGVLLGRDGLAGSLRTWGYWILRGIGGFAVLFITFAWLKCKPALAAISAELAGSPNKPAVSHSPPCFLYDLCPPHVHLERTCFL